MIKESNETPKRRRAPAAERGRERVLGAAPSNTAPYNTIIVNHRVDSLYLSYDGTIREAMKERLEELKQLAASSRKKSANAQIELNGMLFKVHDKGRGMFKYVISNQKLDIQISTSGIGSRVPLTMVQVKSDYLYDKEIGEIESTIKNIVDLIGVPGEDVAKVSRCDLCCDVVTDYPDNVFCGHEYVTRSRKFAGHYYGLTPTGITYGMGSDLAFRLYDKTHEIDVQSKKHYMHDIWRVKGWDSEKKVWRCEFEIKRNVLRSAGIYSLEHLYTYLSAIWIYCTYEWAWLPIKIEGETRSDRWPTHPFWQVVQTAFDKYDGTPLIRHYDYGKELSKESMFRSYRSGVTHFMAMHYIDDIDVAHQKILSAFKTYYNMQGYPKLLENDIAERVADKRRQHNYKLNSSTSMTNVWK